MSKSVLERLQRLPRIGGAVSRPGTDRRHRVARQRHRAETAAQRLLPLAGDARRLGDGLDRLRPASVLATFLIGPLETYLDGLSVYSLPWRRGTPACARRSSASSSCCSRRCASSSLGCRSSRSPTSSPAWPIGVRSWTWLGERSSAAGATGTTFRWPTSSIDGFKAANDHFGHAVGDRVLIALAGVAGATARSVDTVARIGGDGFFVHMPETEARAALPLAETSARGLFTRGGPERDAHHLQRRPGHLRARSRRHRGAADKCRRTHVRGQSRGRRRRAARSRGRGGVDGLRRPAPAVRAEVEYVGAALRPLLHLARGP